MKSVVASTTADFENVLGIRNAEAMVEIKEEFGFRAVLFMFKDSIVVLVKYFARLKMKIRDGLAKIFDLIIFEGGENWEADAVVIGVDGIRESRVFIGVVSRSSLRFEVFEARLFMKRIEESTGLDVMLR